MNRLILLLMAFALSSLAGCAQKTPKGRLVYCSYSDTRHGGLGRSYCELVADSLDSAKIKARYDIDCHYAEETRKQIPVDSATVAALEQLLRQQEVWKLDGYHKEEPMEGGTTHRIHVEFSDGSNVTASWFSHSPKEAVVTAYHTIKNFLDEHLNKAKTE